jgi:predicted nucleic acid-binding protein
LLCHCGPPKTFFRNLLEQRDPADRLLVAAAIELACPLVTYDERIARFAKRHGPQYRFTVAA